MNGAHHHWLPLVVDLCLTWFTVTRHICNSTTSLISLSCPIIELCPVPGPSVEKWDFENNLLVTIYQCYYEPCLCLPHAPNSIIVSDNAMSISNFMDRIKCEPAHSKLRIKKLNLVEFKQLVLTCLHFKHFISRLVVNQICT